MIRDYYKINIYYEKVVENKMINNFENQKYIESIVRKLVCITNLSHHYGKYLENIDPLKMTNYKLQQAKSKISMSNRQTLQWRFNDIRQMVPYIVTSWNGHQIIYSKKQMYDNTFDELITRTVHHKFLFRRHKFKIEESNNALQMLDSIFKDVLNTHYWMLSNLLRELSSEMKSYKIVEPLPFSFHQPESQTYLTFILNLCFTDSNLHSLTGTFHELQDYKPGEYQQLDDFIEQLSTYNYRKLSISEYEY